MPIKIRPSPIIPDHEVLRKIGGGAYGEVWLARGVTGALRGVKVVWREDFEDTRGFEREFEGILKFEPISRDHPALMNILHVGRSPDGVSFYYYVMELGDDVVTGREINPIEYEPRTLRADNHQGAGVQWDTNECIDVGLRLAEALGHLHERGLAHRDVKPSNVIFVNGRAKLADIGLVATRGQRTFVGTEGFVPPEGPGSSQADVYSLGKVLYEIATGKDRLSFPELPEEMPSGTDRKRWLELNRIICDICEPRISKRKISSAVELANALRRIQRGKRRRLSGMAVWMSSLLLLGVAGWASWEIFDGPKLLNSYYPAKQVPQPVTWMRRVVSNPADAEVFDMGGKSYGRTPNVDFPVTVGEDYSLILKKSGYSPCVLGGKTIAVTDEPLFANLEIYSPPQIGETWKDHLGNSYQPVENHHESYGYVTKEDWLKFAKETKRPESSAEFLDFSQSGKPVTIVLAKPKDVTEYCAWFREGGYPAYIPDDYEVTPIFDPTFVSEGLSGRAKNGVMKPFKLLVRQIPFGQISITTEPSGVEVYLNPISDHENQVSAGTTDNNLTVSKLKPGVWQLYLVREGYKPLSIEVRVKDGEHVKRVVSLAKNLGVVFGKPWKNGIGMRFVPLGQDLMASIWEIRVRDYELFVKESGHLSPYPTDFPQTPDDPVVNVTRDDAREFCTWLTERERKDERIAQTHVYRLPTDLEWSEMAGLQEDPKISPSWRHGQKQPIFPWGLNWLRSDVIVGNFADVSASRLPGVPIEKTIPGYDDAFTYTAPVGSFPANSLGLYDISGNVEEWVDDDYSKLGTNLLGVLRGGSWNSYQAEGLFAGSRNPVLPSNSDSSSGFRVVLAKLPIKSD